MSAADTSEHGQGIGGGAAESDPDDVNNGLRSDIRNQAPNAKTAAPPSTPIPSATLY
jgi:hypothetical protein